MASLSCVSSGFGTSSEDNTYTIQPFPALSVFKSNGDGGALRLEVKGRGREGWMGLRNKYSVWGCGLVPLIPTIHFCSLKGCATKLNDPHRRGISISMTKRTKGEKKIIQMLLESNQFAPPSLNSIVWSKADLEPLLVCDGHQIHRALIYKSYLIDTGRAPPWACSSSTCSC